MADEEALLKKKLENTTDFEERREIRQQLRELRKKKLDALQSDTTANERPRRRERVKREEQSSVITETKTTSVSDSNSSQPTQTTIEVNYSRTVVTEGPSENGIENGHVESEKLVEEETVCVEDETPVEEQPVEVESGTNFTVQINGEKSQQDSEEEQGLSEPQEISTETEIVVETSETATDGKEEETEDKEEEMEEVELTPEVIEKMEDVDQLEKLLKDVPLNEYALRKAIRLQIRQLKVKQEANKQTENVSRLRKENRVSEQDNLPGNDTPSKRTCTPSPLYGTGGSNETKTAGVSTFDKLEAEDKIKMNIDDIKRQSLASDSDADDASSSISSSTSEGTCTSEPNPKTLPLQPPKPLRLPASTTTTDSELKGDFKTKILGASASPLRDLTKKPKPSGPEQLDFRGQLKKTGLRADKDLSAQGKKQQQEGDFRRQLKTTGVDTWRNLSAARNVGKKKGGVEQIDFRGHLNKTKGSESPVDKKGPPRPPLTYLSKKAEAGASAYQSPVRTQTREASEDVKAGDAKESRKISSTDLLNMLHKPVETSKESFLVQRGIKKAESPKSTAQKFIVPATGSCDENFQARMAQRKERSDKLILSVRDSQAKRRTSSSDETKDFRAVLKKAAIQKSRAMPKEADQETEEGPSTGKVNQNERFSVDIQDKNELQKLRAQLIQEKETKDKTVPGGKRVTKTVKSEGDGTKEVTTTTEKTTEVEETDAGPAEITTEVKKTTEVHKAGGATMTVTKTSRTTEVRQTGGSKGMSIDALFAQKKREKMMAKKQLQADTKNKRMAFKQQLEAQSPKVEGAGRNFTSGNTAVNQLQEWCRRRTKYHEGVDIQNFTTSWANGLAMCALLNYFLPEKIPYDTLDPNDKRGNWGLAFKVAGEEGIEPLLELEDVMSVEVPEPKSLITYVHFIYQHFAEKQQLQKKA